MFGADGLRRGSAHGIVICGLAWACNTENPPVEESATQGSEAPSTTQLPSASIEGEMSVEEALNRRRSVREYSGEALTETEIAQLLWAGQGITHGERMRTAPSAGALYPLELYVASADGLSHYDPAEHVIELLSSEDLRHEIYLAGLSQDPLIEPPAVFVISGFVERTAEKYGDRAERFMHIEAGHAAQNILLQAVALGLGAVPIGAFNDGQLRSVLGLASDEAPLYLIPVGNLRP